MDLTTFYALMSVTCFTLVGLWWTAIENCMTSGATTDASAAWPVAPTCHSCCPA